MIADRQQTLSLSSDYPLESELRRLAHSDERGVPLAGRERECAALRSVGARDLSLGRIFEGHLNAGQLVARCGTSGQRSAAAQAIDAGLLFAVWNTQDDAPLQIVADADGYRLSGSKTWASGAGSIGRALVTAAWADGTVQMCLVPLDELTVAVDDSAWRPLGMHASKSFSVDLSGVHLRPADVIGSAGAYEQQPWFFGGALRFAAVQAGAIDRLVDETIAYLQGRDRATDPFQCVRVAEMRIARATVGHWLAAGVRAWQAFDAEPTGRTRDHVLDTVDMARTVIERAALDTIERAVRSVGARGLVEPLPFAGLVRDLHMYLRQPAPDAVLLRIGRHAFTQSRLDTEPLALADHSGI